MSFTERIQTVVEELTGKGISQSEISRAIGVARGTVSAWANGRVKKAIEHETALAIERVYSYNHKWLLRDELPKMLNSIKEEIAPYETWEAVRLVNFNLKAGVTGFAVDYLDNGDAQPLFFKKTWFIKNNYNPSKLFAIKIKGESMQPTLNEGSLVVVNTEDRVIKNNNIYAVNHHGELVVKRISEDMNKYWLVSDNNITNQYPRVQCDENTIILGKIIYCQYEL